MHTKFAYDGRGFISQTNTYRLSSAQPYSKRDYYRDTRDRIYAWKKGTYATINPMENGRGDRYTYDAEGQLTAASYQALTPNTTPTAPTILFTISWATAKASTRSPVSARLPSIAGIMD
jgi:hypothetical protein